MEATGGVITGRGILCAFSKRYSLFFLFFESIGVSTVGRADCTGRDDAAERLQ